MLFFFFFQMHSHGLQDETIFFKYLFKKNIYQSAWKIPITFLWNLFISILWKLQKLCVFEQQYHREHHQVGIHKFLTKRPLIWIISVKKTTKTKCECCEQTCYILLYLNIIYTASNMLVQTCWNPPVYYVVGHNIVPLVFSYSPKTNALKLV